MRRRKGQMDKSKFWDLLLVLESQKGEVEKKAMRFWAGEKTSSNFFPLSGSEEIVCQGDKSDE